MSTEQLKLFLATIELKNSWGKNEITKVALEIASGVRTEVKL